MMNTFSLRFNIVFLNGILLLVLFNQSTPSYSQVRKVSIADTVWQKDGPFFTPPKDTANWGQWRKDLLDWRAFELKTFNDSIYEKKEFKWTSSSYVSVFFLIHDTKFYNTTKGEYDIKGFVDYYTREYGKIDNVIMWQLSPNVGFDNRNQYDFFRGMPGGIKGLRKIVDEFHRYGIRFFVNNNPPFVGENIRDEMEPTGGRHYHFNWKNTELGYQFANAPTRTDSSGGPVPMAKLVKQIDADGVFLNCWAYGGDGLNAELNLAKKGVAVVGEWALDKRELVEKQHMQWGLEYFGYPSNIKHSLFPGAVMRNKWIERRHMIYMIDRRRKDLATELQMCWMNGVGIVVWEDIFGIWRGWNERDRSVLRSLSPILRRYTGVFTSEDWTPMVSTLHEQVYANLWQKDGIRLWTLMNRSKNAVEGNFLRVNHLSGNRYFDLFTGKELMVNPTDGQVLLGTNIAGSGITGFIAVPAQKADKAMMRFLANQALTKNSENTSTRYPLLPVTLKPFSPTSSYSIQQLPEGMKAFAETTYTLEDSVPKRETGEYNNTDFLPVGGLNTSTKVHFNAFAIDSVPVTNARFKEFLLKSGYQPRFKDNFLKHWMNGNPPAGKENEPVVYVDLEDARAYAKWAGKRLPSKEEWQYAVESGNAGYGEKRIWEWNESERTDGRTRFLMLKGGPGDWKVQGPSFYAPSGPQKTKLSAKYMLMWPGLDRLATIGFRCAVDINKLDGGKLAR